MADSNITKRALATSLKELMIEQPFDKINVAQICERCNMNRKSFYYHFKDKYDLVNWIFDTEFIELIKHENLSAGYAERWAFIEKNCRYFYQNHSFYRKALQIKGQNSFSDHFQEYIRPLIAERISSLSGAATGASWLCYYYAIQNGVVSIVVPIDKMSILLTLAFSYFVFGEKLSKKAGVGLCLMAAGTLTMTCFG